MMISTRGRYALRVMLDLAQTDSANYVPLKEIADREGISKEYLNNILKTLVEENLLISLRGKGGGYKLTGTPESYTIGSILRLTEGDLSPVPCAAEDTGCSRSHHCRALPMWQKLNAMINNFFDSITLADLMDEVSSLPSETDSPETP